MTVKRSEVWTKGSPEGWYQENLSWRRVFKKSIFAYTGMELLIYILIYMVINVTIYRAALTLEQQKTFENVASFLKKEINHLNRDITFLLGFYVSLVINRWWQQYSNIPWPEPLALLNTGLTMYETEEAEKISEDLLRFEMLSFVLCLRKVSKVIQVQFLISEDIIEAGLATPTEIMALEEQGDLNTVWWVPLQWAMHRIKMGKQNKQIPSDQKEMLNTINDFWQNLQTLESHRYNPIPPIYRQVVHLAVYSYFGFALIGYQVLDTTEEPENLRPFVLILEYILFVGWLKVAEALKDPFGDDEDDFQIGPMLSRHIWACGVHLKVGKAGIPQQNQHQHQQQHQHQHQQQKGQQQPQQLPSSLVFTFKDNSIESDMTRQR